MSNNDTEFMPGNEENENLEEQMPVYSYQQLMSEAGKKLQERVDLEVENFTQQVTMVNNAASLSDVPAMESQQTSILRQHYLTISAEGFKNRIKEEIEGFSEHIISMRDEEAAFNERAKLLLQCHTMSAYITNCLMDKLQKRNNSQVSSDTSQQIP